VKNVAKGKDVIKDHSDQTCAFFDESLEEAMKSSSLYEADEDNDATLSITNPFHNKCMNLIHLPGNITSVF
jgi:hypothetical protein